MKTPRNHLNFSIGWLRNKREVEEEDLLGKLDVNKREEHKGIEGFFQKN